MSQINDIRLAIHAAVSALPGLEKLAHFDALRREDAMFAAKRMPAFVLVYGGRVKGDGPLAQLKQNTIRFRWETVIVTENWMEATAALSRATFGAEALVEILYDIRAVDLLFINEEPVRLQLVDEEIVGPPDRAVDAGPAMYVTKWRTTEVLS